MLMFGCEIEDHRPLACLTSQVNPHKIMQHPARRRMVNPFTPWVGKRRRMVFERLADAVFQGGIHQQPTFRTEALILGKYASVKPCIMMA